MEKCTCVVESERHEHSNEKGPCSREVSHLIGFSWSQVTLPMCKICAMIWSSRHDVVVVEV